MSSCAEAAYDRMAEAQASLLPMGTLSDIEHRYPFLGTRGSVKPETQPPLGRTS